MRFEHQGNRGLGENDPVRELVVHTANWGLLDSTHLGNQVSLEVERAIGICRGILHMVLACNEMG